MDKQEYKIKTEEMKSLIKNRDFFTAVAIADEIDWTRVRSVAMLCTVSDLYKVNRRYEDSKRLLLMAYERHPNGRMILYSLCELCIKMGEVIDAVEYYKKFVQLAPTDNGKYILQYKLYVEQEVSLEERIAVLEELKKRDYREKWGYELAYLYHRIGLATKCVEECDELILWFSDGRYVKKAMELKMLHQPLTPIQEANYNSFIGQKAELPKTLEKEQVSAPEEIDIQVKTVNVGIYDTINLEKALAEGMRAVLNSETLGDTKDSLSESQIEQQDEMESVSQKTKMFTFRNMENMEEVFFEDQMDEMSSTFLEEEELAEDVEWQESDEEITKEAQESIVSDVVQENNLENNSHNVPDENTKEIPCIKEFMRKSFVESMEKESFSDVGQVVAEEESVAETQDEQSDLILQEAVQDEKQITGQMDIEDVLEEWEKIRLQCEEKGKADLNEKIKMQAGNLFTEFETKVSDSILEEVQTEDDVNQQQSIEQSEEADFSFVMEIEEGNLGNFSETEENTPEEVSEDVTDSVALQNSDTERFDGKELNIYEEIDLVEENEEYESEDLEEVADRKEIFPQQDIIQEISQEQEPFRELTEEEKILFAPFIQTKGGRRRFVKAMDNISLAAYTGNVVVTGQGDSDTATLAVNIMKNIQLTNEQFSGVIAKVSGVSLNGKSIESIVAKLDCGGLIIEQAGGMNKQAVKKLLRALNKAETGIVVILEENTKVMRRMLTAYPEMKSFFNARIEIEELSNDMLAEYGRQYAEKMEYAIDELGMLALQTRIEECQTTEHVVTVTEVREMIEEAIDNANRKNIAHLFDLFLGKLYDKEDMIILKEKDFI